MNAYVYLNAKAIHPPSGETTGRPTDFETHPHGASTRMHARHLKLTPQPRRSALTFSVEAPYLTNYR